MQVRDRSAQDRVELGPRLLEHALDRVNVVARALELERVMLGCRMRLARRRSRPGAEGPRCQSGRADVELASAKLTSSCLAGTATPCRLSQSPSCTATR